MVNPSPIPFLDGLFDRVAGSLPVPDWLVAEGQHRAVLLINHVLMQEPEAMARLTRQQGRIISVAWRIFSVRLQVTPAGLFDLVDAQGAADLSLSVIEESPLTLVQAALTGAKPPVRIEGDVQLAAEVNWLADHVRWDLEEDLSRLLGDGPAHALVQAVSRLARGVKDFVGRFPATSIVRDKDPA
ncbi:MAG: hypothetical protein JOY84_05550 [Curvibacter sp.]|nr:hypothetical protein [Curvibacter sp.]